MPRSPLPNAPRGRRAILGLVAGLLIAAADTVAFRLLGVQLHAGDQEITALVMGIFALTFAGFGYLIGRFAEQRDLVRKQYAALQQSQRELVESEKLASLGRMAAGVAHEVRNPLGVIRTSASLIIEDLEGGATLSAESETAANFIVEEVDRLDAFVRSVLDFSRPVTADPAPTPPGQLLDRAHRLAAGVLGARELTLQNEAGDEAVPVDADLAVQALLGLLVNASQSTGEDGRITLQARRDTDRLCLEVSDDGPGVPAENREKIFEPFFTSRPEGTGLGLAMGRRIAEAHGGALELADSPRGARFRLTLPLADSEPRP